jgi:hypothetical protein
MPRTKKTTTKKTATAKDTFQIKGEELLKKVRELIAEGNVRRITIEDKNGRTILVLPLTLGVVGALVAPALSCRWCYCRLSHRMHH